MLLPNRCSVNFTAAETALRLQFGNSVSIEKTLVVVGAQFAHGTDIRSVAADVFNLNIRFPETKLLPTSIPDNALFGEGVRGSSDTIVVDAYRDFS